MTPTILEEKKTQTSVGMETPTETVNRVRQAIQPAVSANDIANPPASPNLTVPPQPTIPSRVGTTVNNVLGTIRSTSDSARKLAEEQAAFQTFAGESSGFDIQNTQLERFGVTPEKLKELEDIQLQLTDRATESGLTEQRIIGGGQSLSQGQREVTQEQREEAVRSAGLAARAAVLQGSIETGRALARDAVDIALQDRTFQANAKLTQINQLKDVVDEETRQLLVQEERGYQAELATIEELKTNIANAMVNGATQSEISQLNSANLPDDQKLALAQSIIARGASEMRNLEIQQTNASIRASNASAARAETGRLLDLAEAGDATAIAELGLTMPDNTLPTADEIAYARQYASTGTIPAGLDSAGVQFGRIAELAADLPKPDGALVDTNTNIASSGVSATDQASFDALYNALNTDLPNIISAWEEINNSSSFTNAAKKIASGETPELSYGTGILGGIQSMVNPTEAMTKFEISKADFLAKLLVARSGAAVTEQEYARYEKLLPGVFNTPLGVGTPGEQKLSALQNQMNSALNDKLSTNGLSIYGFSTVKLDGQEYKVGEIVSNEYGQRGRVNPDGSITPLNN